MNPHHTARMGYGEADITPEKPVELVGFFRPDNKSAGVLHPLKLQAVIWQYHRETACLIAIDSLGFTVGLSNTLRDRVALRLSVKRENIMLCFSHTHAAPNAAAEPEYFEYVCKQAGQAAEYAYNHMSHTYAGWGIGENTIGVNRRNDPDSMDPRLGILSLADPETLKPRVLLLRVTAHANILSGDNFYISADYFGLIRDKVEKKYGCRAVLIQGAAGDVRPKFHQDNTEYLEIHCYDIAKKGFCKEYLEKYRRQSLAALEMTADSVLKAAEPVIGLLKPQPICNIGMWSCFSTFAADVPSLAQAAHIAEEAWEEAGIDGAGWLAQVEQLHREGVEKQFSEMEIQYCFINEGCLCGTANEAMSRIAMDIMDTSGSPLLFFNGYTNGCSSYLPTAGEYDKGGYEVLWSNLIYYPYHGRVMPFNRETAGLLTDRVVSGWSSFKNRNVADETRRNYTVFQS